MSRLNHYQMAVHNPSTFSNADLDTLQHLSDLLHLFHHRNKNQHRRSIWWRHFSTFRRQLNVLTAEIKNLHEVPTTHLQRSRKRTRDRETEETISKRIDFWTDVLVVKWHTAFSQIVADGRFAVLGLVLIAVLAQACQVTHINAGFDESELCQAEQASRDLGEAQAEPVETKVQAPAVNGEDLGEVIERVQTETKAKKHEGQQQTSTAKPKARSKRLESSKTSSTPAKKRRKKGNAIDDLFSGLE